MLNNPHWLSLVDKFGEEKELSENAIQDCIETLYNCIETLYNCIGTLYNCIGTLYKTV